MEHAYATPPGGPSVTDAILHGAIDLHHHGYPEIGLHVRTRLEDADELALVRAAGMHGIVLKSHMWPTVGRAYLLERQVPGVKVFPSITLNVAVGGFNPLILESAARQGARMVFMPTWSAANDLERGGMSKLIAQYLDRGKTMLPERGLRALDERGRLLPEVGECLAVAGEYKMALCTGHLAPRESMVVAQRAKDYGVSQVIFSHPDAHSVGAVREEIRDMAQLGCYCEFCALGVLPPVQRASIPDMMEIIAEISPDRTVLTTDYFFEWAPPAPETLRMLVGSFLHMGMAPGDLVKMVRDNPARILGLPAHHPDAAG